jgi:RND family efflux transporter MFP subunit
MIFDCPQPKAHFGSVGLGGGGTFLRSVVCGAVLFFAAHGPAAAQPANATPVEVDAVRSAPLRQTVPVIGRMVPRQTGEVAVEVDGAVAEFMVEVGDRVAKGDIIAVLSRDRLSKEHSLRAAETRKAQASVKNAEARLALTSQEMKRIEGLSESVAFSQARFDDKRQQVVQAESAVTEAKANQSQAQMRLALAKINLADTEIRAPYPGAISKRHTEVGSFVKRGEAVVSLVNDNDLEIEADVPALRTIGLPAGAIITFRLARSSRYRTKAFQAAVRAVVPEENPLTRTQVVRFVPLFEERLQGLVASQSVTLDIPAGEARDVISLSKDAVLARNGKRLVFVVENGLAQIRPVVLGEAVGDRFEILSGLIAGDLVVVRGNERLRPGQAVSHTPPPKATPGASGK